MEIVDNLKRMRWARASKKGKSQKYAGFLDLCEREGKTRFRRRLYGLDYPEATGLPIPSYSADEIESLPQPPPDVLWMNYEIATGYRVNEMIDRQDVDRLLAEGSVNMTGEPSRNDWARTIALVIAQRAWLEGDEVVREEDRLNGLKQLAVMFNVGTKNEWDWKKYVGYLGNVGKIRKGPYKGLKPDEMRLPKGGVTKDPVVRLPAAPLDF